MQEAVDSAKNDLPDLEKDPDVHDIDISEVPIMNVNLSGDYDLQTLKRYAEMMQDRIETLKEIRRVDIVGALDREIQINVIYLKSAQRVSVWMISQGLYGQENVIIAGGQLSVDGMKRSLECKRRVLRAKKWPILLWALSRAESLSERCC